MPVSSRCRKMETRHYQRLEEEGVFDPERLVSLHAFRGSRLSRDVPQRV